MPYNSGLTHALAPSCPYHFTFYPRAIVDNILLVDFCKKQFCWLCCDHIQVTNCAGYAGNSCLNKETFMSCL